MSAAEKARRLQRVARVRGLQLTLAQAEESRAARKLSDEQALRRRILTLADDVSPAPASTPVAAGSLMAAAHFRDRLHQSVAVADQRVAAADQGLDRARAATLDSRRDQSAVEKLIARGHADAALRELRALENAPPLRRRNRHDPC